MRHAERVEDASPRDLLPASSGDALRHHARHQIQHVLILEGAAEFLARIEMTQRGQHASIVEMAWSVNPIVARQTGAVGQQVAQGALLVCDGVLEPEFRQDLAHRHVPAELALIHQQCEGGRGKGFRDRADRKQRVGVDPRAEVDVPQSEGLQQGRRTAPEHRHRQAGDVPLGHHAGNDGIKIGDKRSNRRSRRHTRVGHGRIPHLEQQTTPGPARAHADDAPAIQSVRRAGRRSRLKARRNPAAAWCSNPQWSVGEVSWPGDCVHHRRKKCEAHAVSITSVVEMSYT